MKRQLLDGAIRSPLVWGLIALLLTLALGELASPRFFCHDDNASYFTPTYLYDFRCLTETGRLAEVNYFQYGGEPFLEQGQSGVLYPPVYLAAGLATLAGDPLWTLDCIAILHLVLGFVGFYFWMRQLGIDRTPATLGGLVWTLNPFTLMIGSNWINVIIAAGFLPWIFWAMERLIFRPTLSASLALGGCLGLLFLQGMAQWFFYAGLFLALYAVLRFVQAREVPRKWILWHLALAGLIFFALALPLILPMMHATEMSGRSTPRSMDEALSGAVSLFDLAHVQFGLFREGAIFRASNAALFNAALFLFPLILLGYPGASDSEKRRLLPLVVLAPLVLLWSTPAHWLLSHLPIFEKFRWPFKVFLFANFFLIAAMVLTLVSFVERKILAKQVAQRLICGTLAAILALNIAVDYFQRDTARFSDVVIPTLTNPLPEANPQSGRVLPIGEGTGADNYRFLSHGFPTLYRIPNVGGYNPLASHENTRFGLACPYPNFLVEPITPEMREELDERGVRYLLVEKDKPQASSIASLPGLQLIHSDATRLVYENTQAKPLAYGEAAPAQGLPLDYAGNSLRVSLSGSSSTVVVSLCPNDSWWYRLDNGLWRRPSFQGDRLQVSVTATDRTLEITSFDPRFRTGLLGSAFLLGLILVLILIERRIRVVAAR